MRRYLRTTFGSLRHRSFALFMAGHAISVIGTWMQKVAQVWLVLELTDSGTLLGVTAALQQLPTLLLTFWGGLLADRVAKRTILIVTQAAAAVPALLLGVLAATGTVTIWMVLVLALVLGSIECFEKPARHAFPIEMVGPAQLTNAVALSNIVINAGKVVGPAVAGVLIITVGVSASFLVNAVSFGAVVVGLVLIRPDQLQRVPAAPRAPGQLRDGLRYVRRQPGLLGPLVLMAVTGMLAYEWTVTLPLLARDTFGGDADAAGLMFTAMGAGAIVGGLAIAGWLTASVGRLVVTGLVFSAVLVLVAAAPTLLVAYALLVVLGAASIAFRAVASSLVQLGCTPEMRGRVMALLVVAIGGTTPLGAPLLGWIGDVFGARATLVVGGVSTALAALAVHIYLRRAGADPYGWTVRSNGLILLSSRGGAAVATACADDHDGHSETRPRVLKPEINELLTRTGHGTPMGNMFRRYWIPALLAEELPENDAPQVRVKILSERLIAFRDSSGRYGLIDEFCAHRGVSLWFGRNEENGLRCAYHGWKFDVTGQAVEVPSEPENSNFCAHVKLRAYPLVKIGDILWTHMGDPDQRPPLPEFEFARVAPEQTYTSKRWQECNWLQAFEGGIDSSHVSWLHSGGLRNDPLFRGTKGNEYNLADFRPFFEVADADGGLFVGARRNAEEGSYYWRITPWVMPSFTLVPPRGDHPVHGHWWVPIDDHNCWTYSFDYHPTRPLTEVELDAMRTGHGVHSANIPGTYRPEANKDNDYLMDRDAQRRGDTFSGVRGIAIQDSSLQESMGPVVDRTKERLVSADSGIIKARAKLRRAALALQDDQVTPPGIDPAHHRVRSAAIVLPCEESFIDSSREALRAEPGKPHASV